jgi:predicted transcriptional regulator
MSLSSAKYSILEQVWIFNKPARPAEIAKSTGMGFSTAMMHLIGLAKVEYVSSPEKGFYAITEKGKRALGIPEVNRQKATEILKHLPAEKAFHFYADIGKPLNISAESLGGFCEKIMKIGLNSVEFHLRRGDFEAWITELGDTELARKISIIKKQKVGGEELRKKLCDTVQKRYEELAKIKDA